MRMGIKNKVMISSLIAVLFLPLFSSGLDASLCHTYNPEDLFVRVKLDGMFWDAKPILLYDGVQLREVHTSKCSAMPHLDTISMLQEPFPKGVMGNIYNDLIGYNTFHFFRLPKNVFDGNHKVVLQLVPCY